MDGVDFNAQHFGHLRGAITLVWCYTLWSCFRFKAAPIRRLDFAGFCRLIADIPTALGHGADRAEAIGGLLAYRTIPTAL